MGPLSRAVALARFGEASERRARQLTAALSGACFTACGRTRDYDGTPNPDCHQPSCACLCHLSNAKETRR